MCRPFTAGEETWIEEPVHEFPEHVSLPTGTVEQAWLYWCCGDPLQQIPPFRRLKPSNIQNTNMRKRLSDFRFVMERIDVRAQQLGLSTRQISMADALVVLPNAKPPLSCQVPLNAAASVAERNLCGSQLRRCFAR